MRGQSQPPQRPDDGPGKEYREKYGERDHRAHDRRKLRALAPDGLGEGAVVVGDQQHVGPERYRCGDYGRQVGCVADRGLEFAGYFGLNGFRPGIQIIGRRLDEIVQRSRPDQRVEAAIKCPGDVLGPFFRLRVPQLVGWAGLPASYPSPGAHRSRKPAFGCRFAG